MYTDDLYICYFIHKFNMKMLKNRNLPVIKLKKRQERVTKNPAIAGF